MQITGTCCKQCKLQGHAETNCMVLHSELLKPKPIHEGVENLNEAEVTGPQSEVPFIRLGRHLKKVSYK